MLSFVISKCKRTSFALFAHPKDKDPNNHANWVNPWSVMGRLYRLITLAHTKNLYEFGLQPRLAKIVAEKLRPRCIQRLAPILKAQDDFLLSDTYS